MNLLTLSGVLQLDKSKYDKGLDEAEGKASEKSGKIGKIFGTLAKTTVAGIAAASVAVMKVTGDSIKAYAEYEQLTGGIQKLYGNMGKSLEEYAKSQGKSIDAVKDEWQKLEDAQNLMMKNAQQGFETTGMSANQYMQSVTGFSAALINSLGGDTKKAAEVADMAMRDIADNANTFGTQSAEELADVYRALAKGQYMTLDNLNLGYNGTKEGMQKLIDKANELRKAQGLSANLQIDSYADIVQAIHEVQTEMNITGTTEREAAKTIEGSINMTKAAWQNLITGFADPDADISKLVENFVKSVGIAASNIVPAIGRALNGIGKGLATLGPMLMKEVPKLIIDLVPGVLKAGTQLFTSIAGMIPVLFKNITQMMSNSWPELAHGIDSLFEMIIGALEKGTSGEDFFTPFFELWFNLIERIYSNISDSLPRLMGVITNVMKNVVTWIQNEMPYIVEMGTQIPFGLANGLIEALPVLIDALPQIINTLVNTVIEWTPTILELGVELVMRLIDGLMASLPNLVAAMGDILANLIKAIIANLPEFISSAIRITTTIALGLVKAIPYIAKAAIEIVKAVWQAIKSTDWIKLGKNVIKGIVQGLKDAGHMVADFLLDLMGGAVKKVKNFFGIHSPSRKMRDEIGKQIPAGMALGIKDNSDLVEEAMEGLHQIPGEFNSGMNDFDINGSSGISSSRGNGSGGVGNQTYIINVNQPVSTPDEMARAIRLESQYGLLEGEPI